MEGFSVRRTEPQERAAVQDFRECRLFRDVPGEALKELADQAYPVQYRKGSSIFKEDDDSDFFFAVRDGLVKLYKGTSSGKQFTFTVAGRGDTLNATAVSMGKYFMSAQALNDVVVVRVARKGYLEFVSRHPSIAFELVTMLSSRLNRECERVVHLLGEDVEHRLSIALLTLVRKFGANLSLTREELANCAGTTTETAIRVLSKLKKEGIIGCASGRGGIHIKNMSKLQDLVAEDEGWI